MRRTTAWALGGVLTGTVLLGSSGTMATLSDTETLAVTAGAGGVDLAVRPEASRPSTMTAGEPLALTVDAASTGAPASLQLTAVDGPGSDACGLGEASLTASVSATWLPEIVPVDLCELLDRDHPLALALVVPGADLADAVLEVRLSRAGVQPDGSPGWSGSLTFTLVQGAAGFSATQDVPVEVGAADPVATDVEEAAPQVDEPAGAEAEVDVEGETEPAVTG